MTTDTNVNEAIKALEALIIHLDAGNPRAMYWAKPLLALQLTNLVGSGIDVDPQAFKQAADAADAGDLTVPLVAGVLFHTIEACRVFYREHDICFDPNSLPLRLFMIPSSCPARVGEDDVRHGAEIGRVVVWPDQVGTSGFGIATGQCCYCPEWFVVRMHRDQVNDLLTRGAAEVEMPTDRVTQRRGRSWIPEEVFRAQAMTADEIEEGLQRILRGEP